LPCTIDMAANRADIMRKANDEVVMVLESLLKQIAQEASIKAKE